MFLQPEIQQKLSEKIIQKDFEKRRNCHRHN